MGGGLALGESFDDAKIEARREHDGSLEIELPRSRNVGGAVAITLFAAFWNGFLYIVGRELPGLFVIFLAPFALVGILLVGLVPVAWLQSTTLVARPGNLTIRQRMFGKGSAREFPIEKIASIAPEAEGGSAGKTNGSVRIQEKGRRKARAAATNLGSKADAQRIAELLTNAIAKRD